MVAAEAAACGALPVVADHSGLGEVARTLREAVPEAARGVAVLRARATRRWWSSRTRSRAGWRRRRTCAPARARRSCDVTRERYSWDGVARTVIAAAQGELDDLPTV